jgi:ATP-dependent DNA ligase
MSFCAWRRRRGLGPRRAGDHVAVASAAQLEITYLTWTADNLLRQTVYVGLREDKPTYQVRRETARLR